MEEELCDREFQRSPREPSADLNNSKDETCLDLDLKNISRQGGCSKDKFLSCPWKFVQNLYLYVVPCVLVPRLSFPSSGDEASL